MTMRNFARAPLAAMLAVAALAACKPSSPPAAGGGPDPNDIVALRAEVERLRKENADLRLSPYQLAIEVEGAMRAANEEKAVATYKQLSDTFPVAPETVEMKKRLETFLAQRRATEDEEKRIAALGFKGLPVNANFAHQDVALSLASVSVNKRWTFDSWGDGWRFLDSEKDRKMLVARMNVASKQKNPSLFGLAAYVPDGNKLVKVGDMRYRFARWGSYGAFLGTTTDYGNEFSHRSRIPFTAAVSVADDDLKKRPLYVVATKEGCHARHFERFGQPQVAYMPVDCGTLKPSLTLEDFKGGALAVLKRID
ncbi:hypothetical protein [Ramlibacter sp. PS4R-6]|uniref:hypothetical protein n=1 Tax=Ramlibacter sp. PS4R-6 TaxID=3133438 RepID=UPI0030B4FDD2